MKVNMENRYQFLSLLHSLRHYPLSCLLIVCIWVLCFMDVPETPLSDVQFIDKWTHLVMYGGLCSVIWAEHLRKSASHRHMLLWGWLAPILMSGLIEILQATCTGGRRSGEWLDFAANSVGATIGLGIGLLAAWLLSRRKAGRKE